MQKIKYITNKELLAEIDKSKRTFCYFLDPKYAKYDCIVDSVDSITDDFIQRLLVKKNTKTRKSALPETPITIDDLVFRVMTPEHIPLSDDKKKRSRSTTGHIRTNFPPFKHYIIRDNEIMEVGRSHWINGLQNGEFSLDHGRVSDRLAMMFMLLTERYSRRGNFRNYSYRDEMIASALLQLSQIALQFDESKGGDTPNPFAFYTTVIRNSFTRILNIEKKNQNIRDDLLIIAGATPSFTRQLENELNQKEEHTEEPKKNGRSKSKKPSTDET